MNLPQFLRPRTPMELASRELDEAKRQLLEAQTGLDYAKRIVDYHADRIKRLTAYVAAESKE